MDRKAVLELVKLRRIEDGAGVILSQGLLGGANDPHLAVADALEVFGQTVEVEDEVGSRGDVLANLVDDKEDVLAAGLLADDVDHFLHAIVLEAHHVGRVGVEGGRGGEQRRVEGMGAIGQDSVGHMRIILVVTPTQPEPGLNVIGELLITAVALQTALQGGHLQVL